MPWVLKSNDPPKKKRRSLVEAPPDPIAGAVGGFGVATPDLTEKPITELLEKDYGVDIEQGLEDEEARRVLRTALEAENVRRAIGPKRMAPPEVPPTVPELTEEGVRYEEVTPGFMRPVGEFTPERAAQITEEMREFLADNPEAVREITDIRDDLERMRTRLPDERIPFTDRTVGEVASGVHRSLAESLLREARHEGRPNVTGQLGLPIDLPEGHRPAESALGRALFRIPENLTYRFARGAGIPAEELEDFDPGGWKSSLLTDMILSAPLSYSSLPRAGRMLAVGAENLAQSAVTPWEDEADMLMGDRMAHAFAFGMLAPPVFEDVLGPLARRAFRSAKEVVDDAEARHTFRMLDRALEVAERRAAEGSQEAARAVEGIKRQIVKAAMSDEATPTRTGAALSLGGRLEPGASHAVAGVAAGTALGLGRQFASRLMSVGDQQLEDQQATAEPSPVRERNNTLAASAALVAALRAGRRKPNDLLPDELRSALRHLREGPEFVVSAAIGGRTLQGRPVTGETHADAWARLAIERGLATPEDDVGVAAERALDAGLGGDEGFVTSRGRFVDRAEANDLLYGRTRPSDEGDALIAEELEEDVSTAELRRVFRSLEDAARLRGIDPDNPNQLLDTKEWRQARREQRAGHPYPDGNDEVARATLQYVRERRPDAPELTRVRAIDEEHARRVADWYENAESNPNDPEVRAAYRQFVKELEEQAEMLRQLGYDMEPVLDDPYPNSFAMMRDLEDNKRIKVYAGETDHPILTHEQQVLFRWVHDVLGHGGPGNQFGPVGEENAFREHARMFSPLARRALATETRGQNSWVNYGGHLRRPDGSIPQRGDPDFVPPGQRPFAQQKAALMPEELMAPYSDPTALERLGDISAVARTVSDLHRENGGATYNFFHGDLAGRPYYAVSIYPDRAPDIARSELIDGKELSPDVIEAFVRRNADLLADERNSLGTWYDPSVDKTYLEVSVTIPNRELAVNLGQQYNQKAIFNLETFESVPTGGTGDPPEGMVPAIFRLLRPISIAGVAAAPTGDPEDGLDEGLKGSALAAAAAFGTRHGVLPKYLVSTKFRPRVQAGARIVQATTPKNAAQMEKNLNRILAKHTKPWASEDAWNRMTAEAFGSSTVPIPPYAALRRINNPEVLAKELSRLSPEQIEAAERGLADAQELRSLYESGRVQPKTTAKILFWSYLSRRAPVANQEALFLDAAKGIDEFVDAAVRGEWTPEIEARYLAWANTVAPEGSMGRGNALANLFDFGRRFLPRMAQKGEDGRTHLQWLHDALAGNQPSKEIRREFWRRVGGERVGIDNKVLSFALLETGRTDVLVIDRVRTRLEFDDGRFGGANIYDGDGYGSLSELFGGHRGLMYYEALEDGYGRILDDAFGRAGIGDASLGKYHWLTWVLGSTQEAGHDTMEVIAREAAGRAGTREGVFVREGRFDTYGYGAQYGYVNDRPVIRLPVRSGAGQVDIFGGTSDATPGVYEFDPADFVKFMAEVKNPRNGVVPRNFKVSDAKERPWIDDPRVAHEKLAELASRFGRRVEDPGAPGAAPAPDAAGRPGTGLAGGVSGAARGGPGGAGPEPLAFAAVRAPDGEVFRGATHDEAYEDAFNAGRGESEPFAKELESYPDPDDHFRVFVDIARREGWVDGFETQSGRFIDRDEAYRQHGSRFAESLDIDPSRAGRVRKVLSVATPLLAAQAFGEENDYNGYGAELAAVGLVGGRRAGRALRKFQPDTERYFLWRKTPWGRFGTTFEFETPKGDIAVDVIRPEGTDKLIVQWFGRPNYDMQKVDLGEEGVRHILSQVVRHYPDANTMEAVRISGVRGQKGQPKITKDLKRLRDAGLLGAAGVLAAQAMGEDEESQLALAAAGLVGRRGGRLPTDTKVANKIVELYRAGKSMGRIAADLGMHKSTVSNVINRASAAGQVEVRPGGRPKGFGPWMDPEDTPNIVRGRDPEAAARLGTHKSPIEREREVVALRKAGRTYKQIGDELGVSASTVDKLIRRAKKRGLWDQVGAAAALGAAALSDKDREEVAALVAASPFIGRPRFYSRLQVAIERGPEKTTGAKWLKIVKSQAHKQERRWSGIEEFLNERKGQSLTRDEVLDHVRQNPIKLTERILVEGLDRRRAELLVRDYDAERKVWSVIEEAAIHAEDRSRVWSEYLIGGPDEGILMLQLRTRHPKARSPEYLARLKAAFEEHQAVRKELDRYPSTQTRFHKEPDFRLPGGENYREILIQLSPESAKGARFVVPEHWGDHENVVVHVRLSDRTLPNGERVLFIEEIQSDWQQRGRKEGFSTIDPKRFRVFDESNTEIGRFETPEEAKAFARQHTRHGGSTQIVEFVQGRGPANVSDYDPEISRMPDPVAGGVPDTPFQDSNDVLGLAWKRVLDEAVDGGYDRIAWTTGRQQVERYDLSKHVRALMWDEQRGVLYGFNDEGQYIVEQDGVTRGNLARYVGEDIAEKLANAPLSRGPHGSPAHRLDGQALVADPEGAGLAHFYDRMVPDWIRGYGKKNGVAVEPERIDLEVPGDEAPLAVPSIRVSGGIGRKLAEEGFPILGMAGIAAGALAADESEDLEGIKLAAFAGLARRGKKLSGVADPVSKVLSRVDRGGMPVIEPKRRLEKAYTYWLDHLFPIKKATKEVAEITGGRRYDPEMLARAAQGDHGYAAEVLKRGVHAPGTLDRRTRGLEEIYAEIGERQNDLIAYRVAKRALELMDPNRPGGAKTTGFEGMEEELRAVVSRLEKDPLIQRLHNELKDYHKQWLKLLEEEGVLRSLTKEERAQGFKSMADLIESKGNQEYTPFFRSKKQAEQVFGPTKGGKRLANLPGPVRRLLGSERPIIDPMESDIRMTFVYSTLVMRQRVANSLAEIAENVPDQQWIKRIRTPMQRVSFSKDQLRGQVDDHLLNEIEPEHLSVFSRRPLTQRDQIIAVNGPDGKKRYYEVEPTLYEALMGMSGHQLTAAVRILSLPASILRTGVTIMPDFAIANFIRDALQTAITSDAKGLPPRALVRAVSDGLRGMAALMVAKNPGAVRRTVKAGAFGAAFGALTPTESEDRLEGAAYGAAAAGAFGASARAISRGGRLLGKKGVTDTMKPEDIISLWRSSGGDHAAYLSMDRRAIRDAIRQMRRQGRSFPFAATPMDAIRAISEGARGLGETFENATRVGEFMAQLDKAGSADPMAATSAAVFSRDVSTDFKRHGAGIVVEILRPMAAFWNARVQGLDKIRRQARVNPKRVFPTLALTVTAPSMALYTLNTKLAESDPEQWDYWDRPMWERNMFWLVPLPEGGYLRIPKPFELGLFFGSLPERMVEAFDPRNPHRGGMAEIGKQAWENFASLLAETFLPIPTAAIPWIENFVNFDMFTGRPIHPQYEAEELDERLKGRERSSEVAGRLADLQGAMTDVVSRRVPVLTSFAEWLQMTPAEIDNVLRDYTGSLGREIVHGADRLLRDEATRGKPPTPQRSQRPLTGRFFGDVPHPYGENIEQFYGAYSQAEGAKATFDKLIEMGRIEQAESFLEGKASELAAADIGQDVAKQFAQLRELRKMIENSPDMTPDEKRAEIDEVNQMMSELAREVGSLMRELKREGAKR